MAPHVSQNVTAPAPTDFCNVFENKLAEQIFVVAKLPFQDVMKNRILELEHGIDK